MSSPSVWYALPLPTLSLHSLRFTTLSWLHKPTLSYTLVDVWYTIFLEFRLMVVHRLRYTVLHFRYTHYYYAYYAFLATLSYTDYASMVHFAMLLFATLWYISYTLLRFLTRLFLDFDRSQSYTFTMLFVLDSDLTLSLHWVHIRYTHYTLVDFTMLFVATLWYISYTLLHFTTLFSLHFS
jgi:hypothetical protein